MARTQDEYLLLHTLENMVLFGCVTSSNFNCHLQQYRILDTKNSIKVFLPFFQFGLTWQYTPLQTRFRHEPSQATGKGNILNTYPCPISIHS